MVRMGHPLARIGGPVVRGHRLVVRCEDRHELAAAPDPQFGAAPRTEGHRVVGEVEVDVAIAAYRDFLPDGQVIGRSRQRGEHCLFRRLKTHQWLLVGRPVLAQAGGRIAPNLHVLVGLRHGGWLTTGQEVAFDVVDASLFHFALVSGCGRPAGSNQETVVLGALPVALLDQRIVEAGFHDGRFQIIHHYPLGHAPKPFEGVPMQQQPGGQLLVEDELHIGAGSTTTSSRMPKPADTPHAAGLAASQPSQNRPGLPRQGYARPVRRPQVRPIPDRVRSDVRKSNRPGSRARAGVPVQPSSPPLLCAIA